MSSTIYDDVFKTLISGPDLIILTFLNEVFQTDYNGSETIIRSDKEYIIPSYENESEKRLSDSSFSIEKDGRRRHYHIECQSYHDRSILYRMYQYDTQIALQNSFYEGDQLHVTFPDSGILYLKNRNRNKKDRWIIIETKQGKITHPIRTIDIADYDIDRIIEKQLYLLMPFYLFRFDSQISKIEKDPESIRNIGKDYSRLIRFLNEQLDQEAISHYTYDIIASMMRSIVEAYAKRYNRLRREVRKIMGGNIIQFPGWKEYHEGIQHGRAVGIQQGIQQGKTETLEMLVKEGKLTEKEAEEYLSKGRPSGNKNA
ncbi:MAG: hypothetical protein IJU42_06220 [Erysipelotrichaceae bacterium]|nr:hypothetical protein [Erysipelotrichaceae bacterium]